MRSSLDSTIMHRLCKETDDARPIQDEWDKMEQSPVARIWFAVICTIAHLMGQKEPSHIWVLCTSGYAFSLLMVQFSMITWPNLLLSFWSHLEIIISWASLVHHASDATQTHQMGQAHISRGASCIRERNLPEWNCWLCDQNNVQEIFQSIDVFNIISTTPMHISQLEKISMSLWGNGVQCHSCTCHMILTSENWDIHWVLDSYQLYIKK